MFRSGEEAGRFERACEIVSAGIERGAYITSIVVVPYLVPFLRVSMVGTLDFFKVQHIDNYPLPVKPSKLFL